MNYYVKTLKTVSTTNYSRRKQETQLLLR